MTARTRFTGSLLAVLAASGFALGVSTARSGDAAVTPPAVAITARSPLPSGRQRIVLAGGCFWGVSAVFERIAGVESVVSGYSGGRAETARYDLVSTGTTGHAESTEIVYDPHRVSLDSLLRVYFLVAHDPTQLNRQGPDDGSQYRSEIFVTRPEQATAARRMIEELTRAHAFGAPIVTEVAPLAAFYPAEAYHQRYLDVHPYDPYIVINDRPKIEALKARFPKLVRPA